MPPASPLRIVVAVALVAACACAGADRPAPEPTPRRSTTGGNTAGDGAGTTGAGSIGAAMAVSEGEVRPGRPNPPDWIREARGRYRSGIHFLGEDVILSGSAFADTEIGGLSGLTYAGDNRYLAISDDRGARGPGRYYTLRIDLGDALLDPGDVAVEAVTVLLDEQGRPLPAGTFDTEGIARAADGSVYVSSEGEPRAGVQPFIAQFDPGGGLRRRLAIPDKLFVPEPGGGSGVRRNLALESLSLTPDGQWLFTATENALRQDGPAADLTVGSPSRILRIDAGTGETVAEYVYPVSPIGEHVPRLQSYRSAGLVDVIALDARHLLALERTFVAGIGFDATLWWVCLEDAANVAGLPALEDAPGGRIPAADKDLFFPLSDLQIRLDNLEGLAFGPRLDGGRRALILVSDNNFNPTVQMTQFLALAVPDRLDPPCGH